MSSLEWKKNDTPASPIFDDIYYAKDGGIAESQYVFLENNHLPERWQKHDHHIVGELGFGTGLNFFNSSRRFVESTSDDQQLIFYSCEKYPLQKSDIEKAMSAFPELKELVSNFLKAYQPDQVGFQHIDLCDLKVRLRLYIGDVIDFLKELPQKANTWFFDGFAPKKNPEMWSEEVFYRAATKSDLGSSFATFASAGFVRRNLEAAGFDVEKSPGFGHKREMMRGCLL